MEGGQNEAVTRRHLGRVAVAALTAAVVAPHIWRNARSTKPIPDFLLFFVFWETVLVPM